jgi:AbrB family looped-hinge helix DNA binding protein
MPDRYDTTVTREGRVLIPAELRRATGLAPGVRVSLRIEGERIVLTTVEAARHRLREMFSGVPGSLSDELIAERRDEARRDASTGGELPGTPGGHE